MAEFSPLDQLSSRLNMLPYVQRGVYYTWRKARRVTCSVWSLINCWVSGLRKLASQMSSLLSSQRLIVSISIASARQPSFTRKGSGWVPHPVRYDVCCWLIRLRTRVMLLENWFKEWFSVLAETRLVDHPLAHYVGQSVRPPPWSAWTTRLQTHFDAWLPRCDCSKR